MPEEINSIPAEDVRPEDMVFGLDIGTRNVVGTVGYQTDDGFFVTAICSRAHKSRAMLDGQIHNISRVAEVVAEVKENLEAEIGFPLTSVCIAAAGRVLVTETTRVTMQFPEERAVTDEDLHTLDLMGIDQAQSAVKSREDQKYRFYCVGYSVMHYFLNGEPFGYLEGHKAEEIAEDIIVTFLPEDVVDGLYAAVGRAGLEVANLTLEPIAAMNVAIPENYRMLNIALVDVGAGTSDICITKNGSIAAYGMIPYAGDELTDVLVQAYLVDFATAEKIKMDSTDHEEVEYRDIMGISHTVPAEEVYKLLDPVTEKITDAVAKKIIELNGEQSVAACFVVGGGGKVHGFTERLAEKLGIIPERVALRGEEVMDDITFAQRGVKKDPLLVTPIGICLNYYEQKNSFIMIHFNGEMMKLYDNGRLTVVDAALQDGFSTEELFPRRGTELHFTVNGVERMIRGTEGESAHVTMNGQTVGLNTRLEPNADIRIEPSTEGGRASGRLSDLDEYEGDRVVFNVNGRRVTCPKFVEVNGTLEPGDYEIREGDRIETRNYYTLGQLAKFMDVELDPDGDILVNNRPASLDTLIYENFSIDWKTIDFASMESDVAGPAENAAPTETAGSEDAAAGDENIRADGDGRADGDSSAAGDGTASSAGTPDAENAGETSSAAADRNETAAAPSETAIQITINHEPHILRGKTDYMFIDIFNVIDFDTTQSHGRSVYTKINGQTCGYMDPLHAGDTVEIGWEAL